MSFSKHKYRILFPILSIPLAVLFAYQTTCFYDSHIRGRPYPDNMKLDCLVLLFVSATVYLSAFALVGYYLGFRERIPRVVLLLAKIVIVLAVIAALLALALFFVFIFTFKHHP